MKNIFFIIIFSLSLINFSYAGENASCENMDKLSKEYVKCTTEKVKKITKEKTDEIKKVTDKKTKKIRKKYKSSKVKKKYDSFKKSKTLKDLFKND